MNADPSEGMTPKPPGEERESGGIKDVPTSDGRNVADAAIGKKAAAANRPLPSFWEPDAYDLNVLDWWGEAYLVECGTLHNVVDERHDHGDILALVVQEGGDEGEAEVREAVYA